MINNVYGLLRLLDIECDNITGRNQIRVPCPIHGGNESNFCINLAKELYYCQVCKEGGSLTKYIAGRYNIEWKEARKLMKQEGIIDTERINIQPRKPEDLTPHPEMKSHLPEGIPLESKYRRISPETMKLFGVYFCTDGYYTNSLIVPVHNELGMLVGFQARTLGTPMSPRGKYMFEHVFVKRIVYNYHRVKENRILFVVEGMASVMNFYEHGYKNVVALLGSTWGDKKADILKGHDLILCLDRDESGDKVRKEIKDTKDISIIGEVKLPLGLEYDEIGKTHFDKYIRPQV